MLALLFLLNGSMQAYAQRVCPEYKRPPATEGMLVADRQHYHAKIKHVLPGGLVKIKYFFSSDVVGYDDLLISIPCRDGFFVGDDVFLWDSNGRPDWYGYIDEIFDNNAVDFSHSSGKSRVYYTGFLKDLVRTVPIDPATHVTAKTRGRYKTLEGTVVQVFERGFGLFYSDSFFAFGRVIVLKEFVPQSPL
jgi:hypothetical protein